MPLLIRTTLAAASLLLSGTLPGPPAAATPGGVGAVGDQSTAAAAPAASSRPTVQPAAPADVDRRICASWGSTPIGQFTVRVPSRGSITPTICRRTTRYYRDISVRLTSSPRSTRVKAVRCSDLRIIGQARLVPRGSNRVLVLARNVRDGTCFRLNFSTPTSTRYLVRGRVSA